jgi:hypothetical protein
MIDEMDLLSGLKPVRPVPPRALAEARAVLRAAIAAEEGAQVTETAPGWRSRLGRRHLAGGVVALGAAAAAVALVVTSASGPASGSQPSAGAAAGAPNPVLTQLAADVKAQKVRVPGNATLEIRNQSPASDQVGANGLDLYTDNGTYYWGFSRGNLSQTVARREVASDGQFQRDIAAALDAVNGGIATARAKMSVANYDPGANLKALQAQGLKTEIEKIKAVDQAKGIPYTPPKPLTPAQKKEQTDNLIWMNSTDALTAAPENVQVRAGVLRILATMPDVKVTHTVTSGQATLTLADSWPLLSDGKLVESLVINASTGVPVALFNRDPGQPLNVTYYHTARVTLADIAAGRF